MQRLAFGVQSAGILPACDSSRSSSTRTLLRWSRWERGRGWHDDWFGGFDLDALDLFASTSATYNFVECRTHVLDQVEPVRHLHGVGRTAASSIGVRTATIAHDHFDARMQSRAVELNRQPG
jgi:hypothetical protein